MIEEYNKESMIIKFKKDVKELKIPDNLKDEEVNKENIVEFILEVE